jgi:hypothetical protein
MAVQNPVFGGPTGEKGDRSAAHLSIDRLAVTIKTISKRQCSAAGWQVSHSLTANPAPEMRARSSYFALDFLV